MPDENGLLDRADAKILDEFFLRYNEDQCLSCPITGARVPIKDWLITNRLCLVPQMGIGLDVSKNHAPMLQITSPAGGVILLNALAVGLVTVAKLN